MVTMSIDFSPQLAAENPEVLAGALNHTQSEIKPPTHKETDLAQASNTMKIGDTASISRQSAVISSSNDLQKQTQNAPSQTPAVERPAPITQAIDPKLVATTTVENQAKAAQLHMLSLGDDAPLSLIV
jgi:hypothetical protein